VNFLVDTNVLAELRKGDRGNRHVLGWFASLDAEDIFLSVLTIGEIRKGVENIRRHDRIAARTLERWLNRVATDHAERILPIDAAIAEEWGRFNVPDPIPVIDGLLAATASVHDLTLATRYVNDVKKTGVRLLNPFEAL
jgi:predicted nucleic acid-binding protein